jgi:hypothetical protein
LLTLGRQHHLADLPLEQRYAQEFLEPAHLPADRTVRDAQLHRRARETEMPGGHPKGAQSIERRKLGRNHV